MSSETVSGPEVDIRFDILTNRLFTEEGRTLSASLSDIYKNKAALQINLDMKHPDQTYHFSPEDLVTHVRGNRLLENLLQQKSQLDWFTAERSKVAIVRLHKVIAALEHE